MACPFAIGKAFGLADATRRFQVGYATPLILLECAPILSSLGWMVLICFYSIDSRFAEDRA
jgi:hypothetical protein